MPGCELIAVFACGGDGEDGSIGGIIMFTEVITDRVKAKQALDEKVEELEKMNKIMVGREVK